jgi:hypothetical protein
MQKLLLAMTLPFCVSGCVSGTPTSGEAICGQTRAARADLASALAVSPDDAAVVAGARLIGLMDAGCKG